jgi:hypothetical protein
MALDASEQHEDDGMFSLGIDATTASDPLASSLKRQ